MSEDYSMETSESTTDTGVLLQSTEPEADAPETEIDTEALVAELDGGEDGPAEDAADGVHSSRYDTTALDGSRCEYGSKAHLERLLHEAKDDPELAGLLKAPWPFPRHTHGGLYLATTVEHRKSINELSRLSNGIEEWSWCFNGNLTLLEMLRDTIIRGLPKEDADATDAFLAILHNLHRQNEELQELVDGRKTVQ